MALATVGGHITQPAISGLAGGLSSSVSPIGNRRAGRRADAYCFCFSQRMTTSGISDSFGRGSQTAPVVPSVLGA
jgi:hypothetical protein